jgi:hypothetical protein
MTELLVKNIAWRRKGVRGHFAGTLSAGYGGIRLIGRDPASGVDVALSIPTDVVTRVGVSSTGDELLVGEQCVVLDLAGSEAILVRELGAAPHRVHVLVRSLEEAVATRSSRAGLARSRAARALLSSTGEASA